MKSANEPHTIKEKDLPSAKKTSSGKQFNPRRNLITVKRCRAKTRIGTRCMSPAMANGRCRMHGGKSTGPRTPEGLARSRRANWKHGYYAKEAIEERRLLKHFTKDCRNFLQQVQIKGFDS